MNLFLALLFIPLSFAGSPPGCGDLGKYLEGFEKDLHKKSILDCKPDLYKTLTKDIPVKDPEFLNGKVCQDLSTIETQLENAKLELAVLNGIEKLKETIKVEKEKAEGPNAVPARVAAMSFVASLNTAQSLEVLLATNANGENGKPFAQLLKEFPEERRATQKDLSDRLAELCKDRAKNEQDACNTKLFKPGPEAAAELLNLLKTSDPKPETIESWKKMLAIKKKNPAEGEEAGYSFNSMQTDLNEAFAVIDSKEVMSKKHLAAIAKIDDFESKPGFSFVEDIADLKNQKKVKIASDKFFLLMGDAKMRQQYEAQSKMSVVWNEVKDKITGMNESEVADCSNTKNIFSLVEACTNSLERVLSSVTDQVVKSKLKDFIPAIKSSVNYANSLHNKEAACREEIRSAEKLSEVCYANFNRDLATVQDKILQLNLVKDKIGSENMELMKYRNFALEKWGQNKDCGRQETPLDFCEDEKVISKNASMTYSDTMKIALIFSQSEEAKTKAETEAKELCENEERKPNKVHDHICDFFNDTTSDIVVTDNKPNEDADGPVTAPDGGNTEAKIRDAWIQGGSDVLKTILGGLMPRQNAPIQNPYPYNYGPYNGGVPPMGIADSILFNARHHGSYGFYMPTPGYAPGTAFPSSPAMSSYSSVGNMGGKYFGR
jgi:hypothetical protein